MNHLDNVAFTFDISFYPGGILRFVVDEKSPLRTRSTKFLEESLLPTLAPVSDFTVTEQTEDSVIATYGNGQCRMAFDLRTFQIKVYVNGELAVVLNERGLFNFEHFRAKGAELKTIPVEATAPTPEAEGEDAEVSEEPSTPPAPKYPADTEGMWEETWDSHTDSKPHGPSSIGMDATFVGAAHVFGLPEHATRFALPYTKGPGIESDPYRLYNLDVFEYELDTPMALYGAVPLIVAHDARKTVGLLWLNPSETWVDVADASTVQPATATHWMSETGRMDVFVLPGPSAHAVTQQYASLSGRPFMPPLFSLGYHQCRWNYRDQQDVATVDAGFDEHHIPYDVMWLDIEHTKGKQYFTWDASNFPDPVAMQDSLARKGRKMVTIVDPHIKRDSDFYIHKEALAKGLYVNNKDGQVYEGHCWPGPSSYPDFTDPRVRDWFAQQFQLDKYRGSTLNLHTWNDMNEPSVFTGPEITMPKDCKHLDGREHRDAHNTYGLYYHASTAEGHRRRAPTERSFILTRSFFVGSQRTAAVWTGDNQAKWEHLRIASPMLLSLSIAGIPFVGSDVGGFFQNPDAELLVRWYQAAAFHPFFRGHAHIETKRREPWLFGEETTARIRSAVEQRYQLLPYWYTLFRNASTTGIPIMRPLWMEFPGDVETFGMDDEFLVGSDLLVKPLTDPGVASARVYLPGAQPDWFDVATGERHTGHTATLQTTLDCIPVFQRAGSIIPRWDRVRRSSHAMQWDPYTLVVAPDSHGRARGTLYLDDGHSTDFASGVSSLRAFEYRSGVLANRAAAASSFAGEHRPASLERILVRGVAQPPKTLEVRGVPTGSARFTHDATRQELVIHAPLPVCADWEVEFH